MNERSDTAKDLPLDVVRYLDRASKIDPEAWAARSADKFWKRRIQSVWDAKREIDAEGGSNGR